MSFPDTNVPTGHNLCRLVPFVALSSIRVAFYPETNVISGHECPHVTQLVSPGSIRVAEFHSCR
jgi:hypothetical protein